MSNNGYAACDIRLATAPFLNPERITVEHKTFPDMFRSQATGMYRSKRRWGAWMLVYDWANLEQDQAKPLIAQFNRFISADTPFTIYDVARPETTGNATQSELALIKALGTTRGQRGQKIVIKDAPANTLCFRAGDLIGGSRNGEMYEVAQDFTSEGTGGTVLLTNFIRRPLAVSASDDTTGEDEPLFTAYVPVRVMGRMQPPDISGGMPIYSFSVEMTETWTPFTLVPV